MTIDQKKRRAAAKHRAYRRTLNGRIGRAAEWANKLAKKHEIDGRISTKELQDLYKQQGGLCLFTGRSLTPDRPKADSHLSLDHIVAITCPSKVAVGSSENMALVRLPINRIKNNKPLCEMFGQNKPILTQHMVDYLPTARQIEIVELQYKQLKALGREVAEGDYVIVRNYRRKSNGCKHKTN